MDSLDKRYLALLFSESLITRIDHWRFVNRIASRTEAIRLLLEFALSQRPKPPGKQK